MKIKLPNLLIRKEWYNIVSINIAFHKLTN